jgi:hypothetical protein
MKTKTKGNPAPTGIGFHENGKMAGVAGLEPVTSAVTGQRSNQLSYTPARGTEKVRNMASGVKVCLRKFSGDWVRAAAFARFGDSIQFPNEIQPGHRERRWPTLAESRQKKIRAADAKEVGVGNPAEETCCYPNNAMLQSSNILSIFNESFWR